MVRKHVRKVKIGFESIVGNHDAFIVVGFFMVVGTLAKLLGYIDFSSDWFWFLAGCGLVVEGLIMSAKQRRFNNKYMVVEKKN